MREYDDTPFPLYMYQYSCWSCLTTHGEWEFSLEDLVREMDLRYCGLDEDQDNAFDSTGGRYCLATKKCFRYGVCQELSFIELKNMLAAHNQDTRNLKLRADSLPDMSLRFEWSMPLIHLPYGQGLATSSSSDQLTDTISFDLIFGTCSRHRCTRRHRLTAARSQLSAMSPLLPG